MSGVSGNLKISLIGKPGALARVEDVMPSLKSCTGPAERFLELWQYAYQCPARATHGREMATVDEFWEDVRPVMNLLIELGKAMPELEIQSVCRVAGAVLEVKFPEADMKK